MKLFVATAVAVYSCFSAMGMEFVTIGNPGNTADTSGYGAVDYVYEIGKYEVSIAEFTASPAGNGDEDFLNDGNNGRTLGTNAPAVYVTILEAMQYCNWLTSSNVNFGVYSISNFGNFAVIEIDRAGAIASNSVAYAVATEDEWYKAAFYTGNPADEWSLYANGTDSTPTAGVGGWNYNYVVQKVWVTGSSAVEQNGTYDMMGNVDEMVETLEHTTRRILRNGDYAWGADRLNSTYRNENGDGTLTYGGGSTGFRIVRLTSIEPVRYSGGAGSPEDPYQIATKQDLLELAVNTSDYSSNFVMTADIDLSGELFTKAVIATNTTTSTTFSGVKFTGSFDGGGHCISNLTINAGAGDDYIGLFGYLGGEVRNLEIAGCSISNVHYYAGALSGFNKYASVSNCFASGTVNGTAYTGGLCGDSTDSEIVDCYATCTASGGDSTGGLCGRSYYGTIRNCGAGGDVTGEDYTGGLCGQNSSYSQITDSYATGNISGDDNVGGLVGNGSSSAILIARSYATGDVSGINTIGGLCGFNGLTIEDCYAAGRVEASGSYAGGLCGLNRLTIRDCYSTGTVEASGNYAGGLCGQNFNDSCLISRCYAIGSKTCSGDNEAALCGENNGFIEFSYYYLWNGFDRYATGLSNTELQTAISFNGFDFAGVSSDGTEETWSISAGHTPKLSWQGINDPTPPIYGAPDTTLAGSGTGNDPFLIDDIDDFLEFHTNTALNAGHYALASDIDLSSFEFTNNVVSEWHGVFDGNGHLISNLTIIATENGAGLFGTVYGSITHFGVENAVVTGITAEADYAGILCGYNRGILGRSHATGIITGDDWIGGLTGYNDNGLISECYADAAISADYYAGGLCGYNNYGMIVECFADGMLSGERYIGGLCGYNNAGAIYDSCAAGNAEGNIYIGGLSGGCYYGDIRNSYATGAVTGSSSTGGFCGYRYNTMISACFWDTNTTGQANSEGGTGISTTQMQTPSTFTDAKWNFTDTQTGKRGWYMPPSGYPLPGWRIPGSVLVPDVTGMGFAEATIALQAAGITAGSTIYAASHLTPADKVAGLSASIGGYISPATPVHLIVSTGSAGDGTVSNPWQIASQADLESINTSPSSSYVMTADIYLGYQDSSLEAALIAPRTTGYSGTPFSGTFDGTGHSIHNLRIYAPDEYSDYLALFGIISGTDVIIKRVGVEAVYILGDNDSTEIGTLCAYNDYGTISQCFADGIISGDDNCGGLCGYNYYGVISESYSETTVSGDRSIGGLCGYNRTGTIYDCYADSHVDGNAYIGGLCGDCYYGEIHDSYSLGAVTGSSSFGGFCGYQYAAVISACFWNTNTSGQATSEGGTGKTTEEMQTLSTFTDANWNFADTQTGKRGWYMPVADYPMPGWKIPGTILVPDTTGMSLAEATAVLQAAGITPGIVTYAASRLTPSGDVAGLSTSIGGYIDPANPVNLIVSTGSGGDGSAATPWRVASQADLESINSSPAASFVMTADIYLSYQANTFETALIAPDTSLSAGYQGTPFSGTFDGAGHAIHNLRINAANNENDYLGVFGKISGVSAVIRDVGVENAHIKGGNASSEIGALCAYNDYGTLNQCHATGYISGDDNSGGLCGKNDRGLISECYAETTVSADQRSGGLCGYNYYGTIYDCYATGSVEGSSYTGGLCGSCSYGNIHNCYATGAVAGTSSTGGLCGYLNSGFISGCFWDTNTTGWAISAGGTGISTAQMQTPSTFTGANWNISDTRTGRNGWYLPATGYPLPVRRMPGTVLVADTTGMNLAEAAAALQAAGISTGRVSYVASRLTPTDEVAGLSVSIGGYIDPSQPVDIIVSTGSLGDGSAGNPWRIASQADLESCNNALSENFVMTADIYLGYLNITLQTALIAPDTSSAGGYQGTPFSGIFDGDRHTIRNLRIYYAAHNNNDHLGLFGKTSGASAVIRKVAVEKAYILGGDASTQIGGLCGYNDHGTIHQCHTSGYISGDDEAGGLCGYNYYGQITECFAETTVETDQRSGGLCGYNYHGTIYDCYATGSVTGSSYTGGFCGSSTYSDIQNCYATGAVSGTTSTGGFCGYRNSGSISDCFWDTNTTGQATSAGGTGEATTNMIVQSTFTDAGWDFVVETDNGLNDIWRMYDYPVFAWQLELTVNNGTGSGLYNAGQIVEIGAVDPAPGYEFTGWTTSPGLYTGRINDTATLSTFIRMPGESIVATPTYFQWDSDLDKMRDTWEQQIVDTDPGDAITTVADVLPEDDFDGDDIANGFEYVFGANLEEGEQMLVIRIVNGTPVVEIPKQDPATMQFTVSLLGSLDLFSWTLPVKESALTSGMPEDRIRYETQTPQSKSFFKLKME